MQSSSIVVSELSETSCDKSKAAISSLAFTEPLITSHLHNVSNLLPLLGPWIHTSGVVSTCMQQDDALLWDFLQHK